MLGYITRSSQISCYFVLIFFLLFLVVLCQLCPPVPVEDHGLLHGLQSRTETSKSLVHRQTHTLTEPNLEAGKLMPELSVHHGDQGGGQLGLLQVPLVPELLSNHSSNLVLTYYNKNHNNIDYLRCDTIKYG